MVCRLKNVFYAYAPVDTPLHPSQEGNRTWPPLFGSFEHHTRCRNIVLTPVVIISVRQNVGLAG